MSDFPLDAYVLADLVQYQDAAIVSKEIYRVKNASITLFAFDKGQRLSEHTAPFDAWVYLFEGEAEISVEGKLHKMKAGEAILMPANKPHAVYALARFKMCLSIIRVEE